MCRYYHDELATMGLAKAIFCVMKCYMIFFMLALHDAFGDIVRFFLGLTTPEPYVTFDAEGYDPDGYFNLSNKVQVVK